MKKTIYVIFLCINCIVCKANNNRIIVWNQDFKCIVNQLITKEHSVSKILQKIADNAINKTAKQSFQNTAHPKTNLGDKKTLTNVSTLKDGTQTKSVEMIKSDGKGGYDKRQSTFEIGKTSDANELNRIEKK